MAVRVKRDQARVKVDGLDEVIGNFSQLAQLAPRTRAPLKRGMRASATLVARAAREKLNVEGRTGRIYEIAGQSHRASAPGEAPAPLLRRLAKSIKTSVSRKGFSSRAFTSDQKAHIMEYGSEKQAPRPFLRASLAEKSRDILATLEKAYDEAIATLFRRRK